MTNGDIQELIGGMTIKQKIGQMFMGNICGGESVDLARRNFERFHFGALQFSGVFERFVRGGDYLPCGVCENRPLEEVARFLADIKRAAVEITGIPAIMGGDQEGGISSSVFRRRNVTIAPAQMGLGACGRLEDTYTAASITAREVKALGLDMLYGPSLDVNTNPLNPEIGARSFGENAEVVASHGEQVIRAFAEHNIISNAKHFPGRGHGSSNAHSELESIGLDRLRLESVELVPFRRAIAAGVDSIMMSHTLFPALESENLPASLSPAIMRLLREELGFEGVILPDTLTMFAVSRNFDVPRACAMCLEAGADMIFMKVQDLYRPTVEAIEASIKAGRLTEGRINESLERILKLKLKRGLFEDRQFPSQRVLSTIGCPEHVAAMRDIGRRSVLALRNDSLMPLKPQYDDTILVVVPRDMNVVLSNDPDLSHDMLPGAIRSYASDVRTIIVDESPTVPQSYEAVGRAKNAELIVFGIYSSGAWEEQLKLLNELAELGKPIAVVITGSPYVATRLPDEVKAIICTFGIAPCTFEAAVDVMFGKIKPSATLPVTINESMPRGYSVET